MTPEQGKPTADAQRIGFSHSAGKASPVDVVRLTELRARQMDHSMYDPTRLDFHLMQFVVSGSGRHWSDFEPVEIECGDILYVRAGQVHSFDATSDHEALLLFFTPDALAKADIPQPARWEPNTVLRPSAADFEILVELIRVQASIDTTAEELEAGRVGPHVLGAILGGIAGVVSSRHERVDVVQQRAESLVLEFETLLDEHHASSRNMNWYASKMYVTPRSLARACQRARGMAPKRLIDLRVSLEAKRMLTTSAATVESIGLSLGFTEATNFVKFFKRIAGLTPDAFRRHSLG